MAANDELRELRIFLVLWDEMSVSGAAARLGISQSGTSNVLARLRKRFGDPLLLPASKGLVPTERAHSLEKEVRQLIQIYDRISARNDAFEPATARRTFVLSCSEHAEFVLLPELLSHLQAEAPGIRIETVQPRPQGAFRLLESGNVDLQIACMQDAMASLRYLPLFRDEFVCVVARRNRNIGQRITLDELYRIPKLVHEHMERRGVSHVVKDALGSQGERNRLWHRVQHYACMPEILARADIVGIVPLRIASFFATVCPLRILPLPLPVPAIECAAYWHERSHGDPGHIWLRNLLARLVCSSPNGE